MKAEAIHQFLQKVKKNDQLVQAIVTEIVLSKEDLEAIAGVSIVDYLFASVKDGSMSAG